MTNDIQVCRRFPQLCEFVRRHFLSASECSRKFLLMIQNDERANKTINVILTFVMQYLAAQWIGQFWM